MTAIVKPELTSAGITSEYLRETAAYWDARAYENDCQAAWYRVRGHLELAEQVERMSGTMRGWAASDRKAADDREAIERRRDPVVGGLSLSRFMSILGGGK